MKQFLFFSEVINNYASFLCKILFDIYDFFSQIINRFYKLFITLLNRKLLDTAKIQNTEYVFLSDMYTLLMPYIT